MRSRRFPLQRGYDVTDYALQCFGGAGGQHACLIADVLGMNVVLVHPFAGVLSAYGMGLADVRALRERTVEAPLDGGLLPRLAGELDELAAIAGDEVLGQKITPEKLEIKKFVHLRYDGSDTSLDVPFGPVPEMVAAYETAYRSRFGFVMPGKGVIAATISVEAIGGILLIWRARHAM